MTGKLATDPAKSSFSIKTNRLEVLLKRHQQGVDNLLLSFWLKHGMEL